MKQLSLNSKLFLLVFCSLTLAITVSVSVTLYTNKQTLTESTFRHLSTVTQLKKRELEALFDDVYVDINIMARSQYIIEMTHNLLQLHTDRSIDPADAHNTMDIDAAVALSRKYDDYINSFTHEYHYSDFYLVDYDHGHILYTSDKKLIGHDLSLLHPEHNSLHKIWKKGIEKRQTLFCDLTLSAHTEQPVMFISTPVYDTASRPVAMLIVQMDYTVINDLMAIHTALPSESEEFYLVGADKLPRSDTRLDKEHRTLLASLRDPEHARIDTVASNAALNGKSGTELIIDYRGVEVFSSYAPVHVSEDIRWALLSEVDASDIFKISPQLFYSIGIMSLILFPLILGITYLLLRHNLINPLNHLTRAILDISHSGSHHDRLASSSTSEFDKIVRSFNALLDSLELTDKELQQSLIYIKKGEEIAGIGIWALDIPSQELYWGENTYKIFGLGHGVPATYETFISHVHPEDRDAVNKAYSDSLEQKCDYRIEHRILREDGTIGYVEERCSHVYDNDGNVIKSIGTIFDFTERKELEQKLQQLNDNLELKVYEQTTQLHIAIEQFKNLFNNTLEAIIISDQNRIIDANEQAIATFGFTTKEQLLQADPKSLIADDSLQTVLHAMNMDSSPIYEIALKQQNGTTFPALLKGHAIPTPDGILRVSTILDISNIKEKESQMLRQSRQAMMGEMIAMIAHQWRQPLASISATAATMQMKILIDQYDKTFFHDQLQKVSEFSQYLSKTIDDFRNFFKAEKSLSEFTLEEVLTSSLKIIEPSLRSHNIEVHKIFEANTTLQSYENELKQVVLNLLKNAEDILVERDTKGPAITLKTYRDGTNLCISIGDNAGGVPADLVDKIFDPYFTTKSDLNGTGLGLYMSKTIVEEHCSGMLTLLSSAQGATFIISLPATRKIKANEKGSDDA